MSRVTLFSLLLALFLGTGIWSWTTQQRDACTPYLSGDPSAQKSEWVTSGTRQIWVPCDDWFTRQPLRIELLSILDVALMVLFFMSSLSDLCDSFNARRRRSAALEFVRLPSRTLRRKSAPTVKRTFAKSVSKPAYEPPIPIPVAIAPTSKRTSVDSQHEGTRKGRDVVARALRRNRPNGRRLPR